MNVQICVVRAVQSKATTLETFSVFFVCSNSIFVSHIHLTHIIMVFFKGAPNYNMQTIQYSQKSFARKILQKMDLFKIFAPPSLWKFVPFASFTNKTKQHWPLLCVHIRSVGVGKTLQSYKFKQLLFVYPHTVVAVMPFSFVKFRVLRKFIYLSCGYNC